MEHRGAPSHLVDTPAVLSGQLSLMVWQKIYRKFQKEGIHKVKPIIGVGGVDCSDTAMQYIYCGATAVQACSAIHTHSCEVVQEMKAGMRFILYANRHIDRPEMAGFIHTYHDRAIYPDYEIKARYEDPDDEIMNDNPKRAPRTGTGHTATGQLTRCVGVANNYFEIRPHIQQSEQWACKAVIDNDMCIKCGTCVVACRDGAADCMKVNSRGVVKIVERDCDGCGLCATVCPIACISMQPPEGATRSSTVSETM
eukprot:gnl/Chilomastix_caulleri/608.p1 GENE.gnl/Chilomastix_caulleri/608~~gnl/Chilomastix_caulleri/608.p1  ORF type:complete len:254 (+),score=75.62 gnl/Chilomastix_caulleri/608:154-915(+)